MTSCLKHLLMTTTATDDYVTCNYTIVLMFVCSFLVFCFYVPFLCSMDFRGLMQINELS